jgi:hypothetical protein
MDDYINSLIQEGEAPTLSGNPPGIRTRNLLIRSQSPPLAPIEIVCQEESLPPRRHRRTTSPPRARRLVLVLLTPPRLHEKTTGKITLP